MALLLRGAGTWKGAHRSRQVSARPRSLAVYAVRKGPVVVIDNYDSFTYNLCQVRPCSACMHIPTHAGPDDIAMLMLF